MFNSNLDMKRQLRAAEAVALFATAAALVLTRWLVVAGVASEGNPIPAQAFATLGWYPTAGIALGTYAAIFALYRRYLDNYPHSILAGGLAIGGVSVLDAAWNMAALARVNIGTALPTEFAAVVAIAATVMIGRPNLSAQYLRRPSADQVQVIIFVFVLVSSLAVTPFASGAGVAKAETASSASSADLTAASTNTTDTKYLALTNYDRIAVVYANNGTEVWRNTSLDSRDVAPSPDGTSLYSGDEVAGSSSGRVTSHEMVSGAFEWAVDTPTDTWEVAASPASGNVFALLENGNVIKINADNQSVVWNRNHETDLSGGLVVSDDGSTVFMTSRSGFIRAIDAESGDQIWQHDAGTALYGISLSPDGETVYSATGSNGVRAFSANDGGRVWDTSIGSSSKAA